MILDSFGRKIPQGATEFVDQVMKVRGATNAPWPAIDLCMNFWRKQHPEKYKSFIVTVKDLRETRKDPKFGSTYDKVHGGYFRYTLDIPQEVMFMIRKIYNTDELPMDRRFFQEFGKRYPECKVAERY